LILYAVYIITKDGREIISEHFSSPENVPETAILSGLLSAFQYMSEDLAKNRGGAEKLNLSGLVYHLRNFGNFQIVIVTDVDNAPAKILDTLGWRFLQNHGERLIGWTGNQTLFEPFRKTIKSIVMRHSSVDITNSLDPTKTLDTAAIFSLPKDVQPVAKALTMLEFATIEELLEEVESSSENIKEKLESLQKSGYVGIREKEGKLQYFATI